MASRRKPSRTRFAANPARRDAGRLAALTFFLDYQNIRRNPLERSAYESARLRGFVVTGKDMGGEELAGLLVRCLPGMVRRAAGRSGPLLFTISRGGTFSKLLYKTA